MASAAHPPHALPRYVQISEFLTREIASGRLINGARMAPERDMAAEFHVSVGTLRKALDALEKQGLLERVQGSGNYIRRNDAVDSVYAMFRLELRKGGGLPRADVLEVALLGKPADLPKFGTSDKGTRIRRLRYLNDTIVAVEEIWLDEAAGNVSAGGLSESLYHYYRTKLNLWISRAEDYVSIGTVPDWSPPHFTLPPGTLTGFIERLSWADAPAPIEYSRTWFDSTQAHYVQRLK
jgi:GntR family transcriptional regulator